VARIAVAAEPEQAYLRVRAVDLNEARAARRLVQVRALPARVRSWWEGTRRARPGSARLEDLARAVPGLTLLGERPGHEVVVGAIGKFWMPGQSLVRVAPSAFRAFSLPRHAKLALALSVTPRAFGGSWISIELRGAGTDSVSAALLRCVWQLSKKLGSSACAQILRHLAVDLGSSNEDESLSLPGDALLQDAAFQTTHAVTLDAPAQRVWAWLLERGRGESAGSNAASIVDPNVGEPMPGLPDGSSGFGVLRAEPARLLILGDVPQRPEHVPPWPTTWAFVLSPIGDDATRLIVRVRSSDEHRLGIAVPERLVNSLRDALERRQMGSLVREVEQFEREQAA
jgi:hypothetical protein